jgi:inner membrane transporter RhtA
VASAPGAKGIGERPGISPTGRPGHDGPASSNARTSSNVRTSTSGPASPPPESAHAGLLGRLPPSALVGVGMVSVQVGAGLAARLFSQLPAAGVTGLRLWSSALIMAIIGGKGLAAAVRDLARRRSWRDAGVAVAFGITLGVMNFSIYQSFARIPLGVAVTIEFLGPLAVAVSTSRRLVDIAWVVMAAAGIALLAPGDGSSAPVVAGARGGTRTEIIGIAFALLAAACWAAYIMLSRSTGQRFSGSSGLVLAMIIAAVVVTPSGIAAGHAALLRPPVLATGVLIGLLSSVIPYAFELQALRRVPARVFGIWMSVEPAVAALVGLTLLSQALGAREWVAIGCVIIASAGAARGAAGTAQAPQA